MLFDVNVYGKLFIQIFVFSSHSGQCYERDLYVISQMKCNWLS